MSGAENALAYCVLHIWLSKQEPLQEAIRSLSRSDCKSTFLGGGRNIAGAVHDADNDDFVDSRDVIDGVFAVKDYSQLRSEVRPRSTGERKRRGLTEASLNLRKGLGCGGLGRFFREVAPDLR